MYKLLSAWRRSVLAKKATLSGSLCHNSIVSHRPTCHLTTVLFEAVPQRRIVRKAFYYNTIT